ncbi:unnamed protein product [Mytilus coruscus]|uniref:HAT C-terminal dimerisation domain-containing protein n=1 Tax=Mytilus coruscus TaxID=42192 RepID=A0A6J8DFG6_MYTCO|nr:unnamed protein product [Mytilus coruscus]
MSAFGSDGAAVSTGIKNGVWAKLKETDPLLITNHCKDHRLAFACRDSYKTVIVVKRLDDTLENLHKYYKYSCNHTKSLEHVQKALGEPVLKVKKAKHHRWLSHGQALRALVTSYRFADSDAIDNLALLDTSTMVEVPETYAVAELQELSAHFGIEDDILLNEWTSFCELIGDKCSQDGTIMACLKFLLNDKLGLTTLYPNIVHLLRTAVVLPLSTAETERVFPR